MGTDEPDVDAVWPARVKIQTARKAAKKKAIEQNRRENGWRRPPSATGAATPALVLARLCSTSARVSKEIGMNAPRRFRPPRTSAEHLAIQLAMELAKDQGVTELVIYNDSKSPVNHVNGNYKVKQEHLIPIVGRTWEMASEFVSFEIRWTSRENTKEADALCRAVDRPRAHRAQAAVHPRLPTSEHPDKEQTGGALQDGFSPAPRTAALDDQR